MAVGSPQYISSASLAPADVLNNGGFRSRVASMLGVDRQQVMHSIPAEHSIPVEDEAEQALPEEDTTDREAAIERLSNALYEEYGGELSRQEAVAVAEEMLAEEELEDIGGDRLFTPTFYMPLVYDSYDIHLAQKAGNPLMDPFPSADEQDAFFSRIVLRDNRQRYFMQEVMMDNPAIVRYNMATMPRPPKKFVMHVDPSTMRLTVEEFTELPVVTMENVVPEPVAKRINWLNTLDASLQFSQAYISPNWYQGGNSNLNMLINFLYNIKLNPTYHPNVIFDTSVAYKLGLNNAPEDSVHNYNISEDIFQINSKFGLKAAKRWYYSVTAQFKTQLLNSYKVNSNELVAAFLSPSELNIGVGMTYSYENPRKTVNFSASIAPFSYNLKTCTNPNLDPTAFGIDPGKTTKNEYGSSVELNLKWKITYNITYTSRLFVFTDYHYLQGDWENTLDFAINRFMSARVYAHLRYDSQAPQTTDTAWRRWQFKEILSIGFNYKFTPL